MKPDNHWLVTVKAEQNRGVGYITNADLESALGKPVMIAECKHPEVAQAVAMLNDMSDKARKQALAHIGVIFKFDKGTF